MYLKELLNDDLIGKIYYGETYLAGKLPNTDEYKKVTQKILKLSEKIRQNELMKREFEKYNEKVAEKEGIEAEFQFKLGFKVAVKLIMEAMQKDGVL